MDRFGHDDGDSYGVNPHVELGAGDGLRLPVTGPGKNGRDEVSREAIPRSRHAKGIARAPEQALGIARPPVRPAGIPGQRPDDRG